MDTGRLQTSSQSYSTYEQQVTSSNLIKKEPNFFLPVSNDWWLDFKWGSLIIRWFLLYSCSTICHPEQHKCLVLFIWIIQHSQTSTSFSSCKIEPIEFLSPPGKRHKISESSCSNINNVTDSQIHEFYLHEPLPNLFKTNKKKINIRTGAGKDLFYLADRTSARIHSSIECKKTTRRMK